MDWETLRGTELDEYKFYNRVRSVAKGLLIIYDTGYAKLRWELLGEVHPIWRYQLPLRVPLLPQQCRRMNSCDLRWRSERLQENWGSEGKRRRLALFVVS